MDAGVAGKSRGLPRVGGGSQAGDSDVIAWSLRGARKGTDRGVPACPAEKWPELALLSFSANRLWRGKRPAQFLRQARGRHLSVLPSHARYLLRPRGHQLGPAPIFEMHGEVRLREVG